MVMMHTLNNKAKAFSVHQIPVPTGVLKNNVKCQYLNLFNVWFSHYRMANDFVDYSIYESSDDLIR